MSDESGGDVARYLELIRSELRLDVSADPLAELAARLSPADPRDRPPPHAPAVLRLGRAVWSMRRRRAPTLSLDEFNRDLQILKLFDPDDAWSTAGLDRLMADVRPKKTRKRRSAKKPSDAEVAPAWHQEDS
jgi:hypothetical protein